MSCELVNPLRLNGWIGMVELLNWLLWIRELCAFEFMNSLLWNRWIGLYEFLNLNWWIGELRVLWIQFVEFMNYASVCVYILFLHWDACVFSMKHQGTTTAIKLWLSCAHMQASRARQLRSESETWNASNKHNIISTEECYATVCIYSACTVALYSSFRLRYVLTLLSRYIKLLHANLERN